MPLYYTSRLNSCRIIQIKFQLKSTQFTVNQSNYMRVRFKLTWSNGILIIEQHIWSQLVRRKPSRMHQVAYKPSPISSNREKKQLCLNRKQTRAQDERPSVFIISVAHSHDLLYTNYSEITPAFNWVLFFIILCRFVFFKCWISFYKTCTPMCSLLIFLFSCLELKKTESTDCKGSEIMTSLSYHFICGLLRGKTQLSLGLLLLLHF